MGQQVSSASGPARAPRRLSPLPPSYTPLCETVKAGDPPASTAPSNDDIKDAFNKILEFGHGLSNLPDEHEVVAALSARGTDQQLQDLVSSVDSVDELFTYIMTLANHTSDGPRLHGVSIDADRRGQSGAGMFEAQVASYVRNLQTLYQVVKKEKHRHEQRVLAAQASAASLRTVAPPPLPLPTQNCLTMGWDLVMHLLRATRKENHDQYRCALKMIQDNLRNLKPTTYSDSMYLAPSAASAFNLLSDCLGELASPVEGGSAGAAAEVSLGASTIETLTEIALARGSLPTLLFIVRWLMQQNPTSVVNIDVSVAKLAALKEQPFYGRCEASGELYCCGQNSYGELGIGDDIERHQLTSIGLCGWDDIRQVVSGNEILSILTNEGVVLTCGLNKSGQCGQGHFDERVMLLRPVQALRSQKIKFIAASNGCEHMIALTETGLAYSWGYNDRGQLGHENLTTKIHIPKLIESIKDKKLVFAAVSYHHSALVTDAGELYTFGMNDCGQLGLDHTQHQSTPQLVKLLEGHEVTMVSCGLYHTIVCTASGELFSCGKNDYGQLGMGHSRQVKAPTIIPLANELVCFVACGYYHSIVVTTTGRAFSFGRNDYGQLGIGTKIHQNVPTIVTLSTSTRMIRAACGCYHTVMLSEQGGVYVFGRNNKGQLGNRSSADSLLPVPLKVRPEKNARRCIDVAAGFYTTSLIVERKRENDDGETNVLDQISLMAVCGRVDIDRSGEIEGLSNFGSISTTGVALFHGKWFYEVEVVTSGLIQIGWIDGYFQGSSDQGEGVGDHSHSWSYDGNRQRRWNSGSSAYGEKWKAGDIIGCLLDLTTNEMTFFRNGINLGVAYSTFKCVSSDKRSGLMPGISLERGEIIRVNLGHQPFAYPPTIVHDFDGVARAVNTPVSSALIKPIADTTSSDDSRPPCLRGSATVVVKGKLFVIGGVVVGRNESVPNAEPSTQVWVYYMDRNQWERWSDFPIPIQNHQAVPIDDEHILVIGGENSTPTSRHMDLYKCATTRGGDGSLPAWNLIQGSLGAATALPMPRAYHSAATIRVRLDAIVFMFGGKSAENEILGDAWYLSLDDFSWSRLPSSVSLDPGPRIGCSSTVIGESVYMFGGQDKDDKLRADLWRYNTFDRVWHLCHDDNIAMHKEAAPGVDSTRTPRSEFNPAMPDPRVNYSICSDLGNVWVLGGINKHGKLIGDLWCYSTLSQKWTAVDTNWDGDVEGCSSAALVVETGAVTGISGVSRSPQSAVECGKMFLVGGSLSRKGVVIDVNDVRTISPVDAVRSYGMDTTKSVETTGKAAHILSILRAKCEGTDRSQSVKHEALDSAICVMAHIDRLAGNDVLGEDTEAIQLSRCTHRQLCIDPKMQTFAALLELLRHVSSRFLGAKPAENESKPFLTQVLFPLLVTVRLFKLNFFELLRSGADTETLGLSDATVPSKRPFHSIRELLFDILRHDGIVALSTEAQWFYHAVKQETAAAIYHGFPILFPSLLDRLDVMNRLLDASSDEQHGQSSAKKLLVPMLVPSFASAKMLFQLMNDTERLFPNAEVATQTTTTIVAFMGTLMDSLWRKASDVIEQTFAVDDNSLSVRVQELVSLEHSDEFKCLNVILRAALFWCSCSTHHGWRIIEGVSSRLIDFTLELLANRSASSPQQRLRLLLCLKNSFPGKLIPFLMLSTFSLPAIRDILPALIQTMWPKIELLIGNIHKLLTELKGDTQCHNKSRSLSCWSLSSIEAAGGSYDFDDKTRVTVSQELRASLLPESESVGTCGDVLKRLWSTLSHANGYRTWVVKELARGFELRRVVLPSDLEQLFGTDTLLIKFQRESPEVNASEFSDSGISFLPSRTVLSRHIYPTDLSTPAVSEATAGASSAIATTTNPATSALLYSCFHWLRDLQKILVWVGSAYASALVIGAEQPGLETVEPRWQTSPLFRGGLEDTTTAVDTMNERNNTLLRQIIDNTGAGKKLLDKVRNALDPSSKPIGGNLQLRARLKRQDSVEATLEKSGGIEAVDRAVRITFAVFLKHSNISYVSEPVTKDGTPTDSIIDAWRSALTLRRWIVREQQKLAASMSETISGDTHPNDAAAKERQQALYATVCEPIIRRAELLLRLVPASIASVPRMEEALKMLPGISIPINYELHKPAAIDVAPSNDLPEQAQQEYTKQLMKLMETKTVEAIEEEDERLQADIFAFIQQSPVKTPDVPTDDPEQSTTRMFEEIISDTLSAHQSRGKDRLSGLKTFRRLLETTDTLPSSLSHIIPTISSSFKRAQVNSSTLDTDSTAVKVHYLFDLEFAGAETAAAITAELFDLLETLLQLSMRKLKQINQLTDARPSSDGAKPSPISVEQTTHDIVLVMEAVCMPYRGNDWQRLHETSLAQLLTELGSWSGWKRATLYESTDDALTDTVNDHVYPIVPAGTGMKHPSIICSSNISVTTDLQQVRLTHTPPPRSREDAKATTTGGLVVLNRSFTKGRWYWEVSVKSQGGSPVFIGVTPGTVDLNSFRTSNELMSGINLLPENACFDSSMPIAARKQWPTNGTIGVLLNCEECRLEFYSEAKQICFVQLGPRENFPYGYFLSIGVYDAELLWDLAAAVPPKLWCTSIAFQFPSAVVSGGLVAVPFEGNTLSWNGKRKSSSCLAISASGNVVTAGDVSSSSNQFETLVATQGFHGGSLFVEVRIIYPGRGGRATLAFGVAENNFESSAAGTLDNSIAVKCNNLEESREWSAFGVLYDFDKGSITIHAEHSDPVTTTLDLSSMQKPFFPAVSVLCNGTVFDANFHPKLRPDLPVNAFHPAGPRLNQTVSTSNELQLGKALQLEAVSCDGGEFSASHCVRNCLTDDASVYSSAKLSNVNIVLRHEIDTPVCVSYINIRGPGPEYSSPLHHAVVFITSAPPDLKKYEAFDDLTPEEFAMLPFPPSNGRCPRDELLPVAYFVLDGSCAHISKQLAYPVTGRYILVKLLSPSAGTNIDCGYIGFCGIFERENGPAYTDATTHLGFSCEECKKPRSSGTVFYGPRSNGAVKLCALCYDDNCGDPEDPHYAFTTADQVDIQGDGPAPTLCLPRRAWNDKIAALLELAKKAKQPRPILGGSSDMAVGGNTDLGADSMSAKEAFDDCELFSCGQNNYGELCLGHCNSTSKLEHVPFFSTKSVRDIAGGNEVLAVVMKDGAVFTCGLNKSGQCGNGTFEERVIIATPVRALSGIPVEMVAAANGCEHMLAVTSDGAVYSWGYNDRGQLGLGSTISKSHTPRLIESLREKYFISHAAVSYHHSAVVASTGELLTFGMNDCGQLGLDHTQHQHTPQLVDTLASQVVAKVACGLYHTVAITTGGDVYTVGKNDYGQLGLGHARNVKVPHLVKIAMGDSDEKAVTVGCGYYHTVIISEKGKLITWGRNDYGQLGIGSKEHKNSPQYVPLPLSSKITTTSCGCYHTLLLLSNGRVMVFGRNNKGQLGASSRTLPSADLPLPIPSNALSNDDVVCIAAGFYSSYILTGRATSSGEQNEGNDSHAKDNLEQNSVANSEALFESLMNEIDSRNRQDTTGRSATIKIKRECIRRKLPLVKLHAGAWAMIRALMYQSVCGVSSTSKTSAGRNGPVNPMLRLFITFLLDALKGNQTTPALPSSVDLSSFDGFHVSLKDACVGLLKCFTSRPSTRPTDDVPDAAVDLIHANLFRNQILWVLLNCGSANRDVGSIIGTHSDVAPLIISGMNSSDLTTATICIRMAMFVFPLHSVSAVTKIHRSLLPTGSSSTDILNELLVLVGAPHVLRPRLCSHELGLECSSTALCQSSKCVKGVSIGKESGAGPILQSMMEKSHIAEGKSAEAIALLRYLTLFPSWKVAVNASLGRSFAKAQELGKLLDSIYAYYSSVASQDDASELVHARTLSINMPTVEQHENESSAAIRKPETTKSPEVEESAAPDQPQVTTDTETQDLINARDKNALNQWQTAQDALNSLAAIVAAVDIVGGHVETLRECAVVNVEGDETINNSMFGTVLAVKKDTRGDIVANAVNCRRGDDDPESQTTRATSVQSIPIKKIRVMERIPALVDMFDGVETIITALSSMILPANAAEAGVHCDLDQPQNTYVHEVLRGKLNSYKKQIQWRSTKALSSLLSQIPTLSPMLSNVDSHLVSNVALLLSSENAIALSKSTDASTTLDSVNLLQSRWVCMKQRQTYLECEQAIDVSLDQYEASIREDVVRRLGDENALSWGLDALQSPRRTTQMTTPAPLNAGGRGSRSRVEGAELPFGTWGVLHPLPPLNENENESAAPSGPNPAVSYTPFMLSTPIVRVGRAADSCDLIINDRSVSGRHFHLRRVRREGDTGDEGFELQDFSKNGTIVNGIRVHGTTVRIAPGSRISLILSRGGLVTYEFQVRPTPGISGAGSIGGRGAGSNRLAPPPIITASQSGGGPADGSMQVSGQEYQQPQMTPHQLTVPRSPAEIQNRGVTRTLNTPSENRMQSTRSRLTAPQGLTLITSIAESEVPRALISPNPAVDSPRVGGFNSPRSSVLQLPGTPLAGPPPPSMCRNMVPPGLLSPASFQQRETLCEVGPGIGASLESGSVGDSLRIALARESLNRGETVQPVSLTQELSKTRVLRANGETSLVTSSSVEEGQLTSDDRDHLSVIMARAADEGIAATVQDCGEALQLADGDHELALTFIRNPKARETTYSSTACHLAVVLGKSAAVCAEALRQSDNTIGGAVRLLLSPCGQALEKLVAARGPKGGSDRHHMTPSWDGTFLDGAMGPPDPLLHYQEMGEENASYALLESSAPASQGNVRPNVSPRKAKATGDASEPLSELSLWAECNMSIDDKIRQMNLVEIEQEEDALWQQLTASFARKVLNQIVRLVRVDADEHESPIRELGEQLALRRLIVLSDAPTGRDLTTGSEAKDESNWQAQSILGRLSAETFNDSTEQTVAGNLLRIHNLLRLTLTIEQADTQASHTGIDTLIRSLLKDMAISGGVSGAQSATEAPGLEMLNNMVFDTVMHIASRTYVTAQPSVGWEMGVQKSRNHEGTYPKGPIGLSNGLEVMVVNSFERMWSIPAPDPLINYRHRWRKRHAGKQSDNSWSGRSVSDQPVTIWRPVLPSSVKTASGKTWFSVGDVAKYGSDCPDGAVILLSDDGSGRLLPPVGYERVDVTGKGLPTNSDSDHLELHRKQQRSVWWPIAPPGYIAIGCVAGNKEDPLEPPKLAACRCVREDLVRRVNNFRCVWRSRNTTSGAFPIKPGDSEELYTAKNQADPGLVLEAAEDIIVETSMWSVDADFCSALVPVITLNDFDNSEPNVAFSLNLSDEDKILCAPVTVNSVLSFVDTTLKCQKLLATEFNLRDSALIRPELPAALFALIKHVMKEKQQDSVRLAGDLARALITVIQCGGKWHDKEGLLYCRSKIMALNQDQESGGFMFSSLFQAFVELMLVVEDQIREERIHELAQCMDKDATISLPYRFHFAKVPFVEMMVSHSSKMNVARHFSGEERKFLLDYRAEDSNPTPAGDSGEQAVPAEYYSCRFEHTPELVMTMNDEIKAEVVYYEVTVIEWNSGASTTASVGFGFSPREFPLEGALVGVTFDNTTRSFSFTPTNGKVQCCPETAVDRWHWNDQLAVMSSGDVFGCGLRLDTHELFFTRNGQLLGTAFSSIAHPMALHPTISLNADCKLLVNFGTTTGREFHSTKTSFSYRFHSLDCENIMGSFEWFEQLSQVYGVMKALMDPKRSAGVSSDCAVAPPALPDEFMLSADNFLSDISEDVCIRVESMHPYDLDLQEAFVNIPLATSIRVKLDPLCETANSHCLQILQGGEATDGSGESEVRAFTGACGAQEVTIDGDSFVWRFPVQSNFQCRVDRVRKGPYLKLENRDTRLSLVRDKGWQTAIGVARFDSGVHVWEVRISFVTASSNIFLGIARKDVRLDSYLGKDNRGWGWIGNRALWHNGSKQRGTYGEKFKTGDVVRMTLDLKRGTLSYALNGKDLGVAFGPGGTGPKLEGTFFPGFALYNQRDSVDLIGGHRVEDGSLDDALLRSGSGGLVGGEDSYYSEDEEEISADLASSDTGIPNFRMELAVVLTQMGFPMEWCVYALKHCEDDAEQAADYILGNMDNMEALVRDEADALARRARQRELLNEAAMAATGGAGILPPPPPIEVGMAESPIIGSEAPDPVLSEPEAVHIGGAPSSQAVDKWGIAFTAVPEFSITGRRLLATKYSAKLQQLHASQAVFAPEHDHAIVEIVNEVCEARAEALLSCDPLRMTPEEFVPTDEHLRRFPCLQGLPLADLQRRFLILRNFNCRLQNSLAFIDFAVRDNTCSVLARGIRELRGVIFQHVKLAWWLTILKDQQAPAAARPEIEIDRNRARDATELTGVRESVFAQALDQLHTLQPSLLRGADRAFKCQFVGEFGDDFGGLYRECLAQISSELQSRMLPVLWPCPNAINAVGENREQFVPNVHLYGNARLVAMAEFLGKLMGIAVRTKTPLDLNLPTVFWKLLVRQPVLRRDVEAIHHGCFQVVDTIRNVEQHGITESMFDEIVDASFTVLSSVRETVELLPGGKRVHVKWEDRNDYARAVERYRLTEFQPVCEAILRGVATILPAPTLALFTWRELLTLVCGKATVDIELLRRRTIYGDGCQAGDPHVAYFWDVLAEFTDEQKSSFLRFVWGRSRLPTHAADFTQDFKIAGLPKAVGRADMYLPIAHTCFFSIDLPAYTSRDVMRDKLLYAITHCQSIDADNTTVAQRAGQGINWTNTTVATATATAAISSVMANMGVLSGET